MARSLSFDLRSRSGDDYGWSVLPTGSGPVRDQRVERDSLTGVAPRWRLWPASTKLMRMRRLGAAKMGSENADPMMEGCCAGYQPIHGQEHALRALARGAAGCNFRRTRETLVNLTHSSHSLTRGLSFVKNLASRLRSIRIACKAPQIDVSEKPTPNSSDMRAPLPFAKSLKPEKKSRKPKR